ncbi:cobalamin B12-binding domain-containing protein [Methanosalsum natronophilum]|uniref:Dimethylamine corrinoid protein 3 n=1 Tax=Methanosalsum natronophilum TaxID=768733 RepID=A0A424YUF2_9EURY|nr:B12-binding domain-containing protein [Methanosalsum natronophilum]MCS3923064.1 trimethylamine corrinoid protein [Methanosalsum natronophilum]RQD82607.1 MAG: dimethylamine corrinoid protein 3 [Methanosalsum natronophilum]
MATKEEIIQKGKAAVLDFDEDAVKEVAKEAIDAGVNPAELIEDGFTAAMNEIGDQFESGTLFLPHVIAASEAMSAGVEVLTPELEKLSAESKARGTVVIGTIEGDIHSIGKDIVATMLKIAGFDIIDLGRDVPVKDYVDKAKEKNADVVASSALMTTTMITQTQIEEQLKEAGLRDNIKTMVGGAPVTQDWANKIGADIYAENSGDAVNKLKALFP